MFFTEIGQETKHVKIGHVKIDRVAFGEGELPLQPAELWTLRVPSRCLSCVQSTFSWLSFDRTLLARTGCSSDLTLLSSRLEN